MNIQRFTAPTSREALAKARAVFGEGTLILSNRQTEHGVEVMATGEDALTDMDSGESDLGSRNNGQRHPKNYREVASQVEEDATQLAMSTLSFQDYVRERMAKRHLETSSKPTPRPATATTPIKVQRPEPQRPRAVSTPVPSSQVHGSAPVATPSASIQPNAELPVGLVQELQNMKALIEDRFNTLAWLGQARQSPVQSNIMMKLICAGYSPTLTRVILERLPEGMNEQEALRWTLDVLERNLRTDMGQLPLYDQGGVFALLGATGVGKTTTTAKLAGLCVQKYGAASVGLITLDTYRIGAHEQLRAYGKMMGVVAHLAHDKAALQDLLGLLGNKKLVLIDTSGIAPRDPRKQELLELIDLPNVKRLLVVNASSQGDSIDEAITCFKTGSQQESILTKTDEAVKLGPVLDAAIRHQLTVRGVTTGQRVPEDWDQAVAAKLVQQSLKSVESSVFDPRPADVGFLFGRPSGMLGHTPGAFHA